MVTSLILGMIGLSAALRAPELPSERKVEAPPVKPRAGYHVGAPNLPTWKRKPTATVQRAVRHH